MESLVSVRALQQTFSIDPETGEMRRLVGRYAGQVAGCIGSKGYWQVWVCGRLVLGHRLAWALMHGEWPAQDIDHINGDTTDNRLCNLRLASKSQNMHNQRLSKANTSGAKGVSWYAPTGKWCAHIAFRGSRRNLGYFASKDLAAEFRQLAAEMLHGDYVNHGVRA